MKKYKFIFVIVLCSVFLLSSCSNIIKQATEEQKPVETKAEELQPVRKRGGEIFIAMPTNIESFNPLEAKNEDLVNLLTLIYETPIGMEMNGKFKGILFNSWTIDSEKKVFTFKLREGVVFSDGTPLTADDILYSAEQVKNINNSTFSIGEIPEQNAEDGQNDENAAPSEEPQTTQDDENAAPTDEAQTNNDGDADTQTVDGVPQENNEINEAYINRYDQYSDKVIGIEKVDELSVKLTMSEGGDAGLHFMTFPVMKSKPSGMELPVGTGPYMAESYENDKMRLVTNKQWWQEEPYITSIVANGIEKNVDKLKAIDTSIIDFTTTNVLYANKYKIQGKIQVIDYLTNYYDCIIPNMKSSSLSNVDVRRALSCAINRREIISTVLLNHGTSVSIPIPPDYFAYETKYKFYEYDLNYAKELLQKAGYAISPEEQGNTLALNMIVLDDYNNAYVKEAAKAIKKQLKDVNIEVTIEELTKTEYLKKLNSGEFDLAFTSFYLDNNHILDSMFDENGGYNYGGYVNKEIEEAIANCDMATETEEIKIAYGKLQELLVNDIPQIGLYFKLNSIVCDTTIKNIKDARQNNVFASISQWYINN